MFEIGVFFTEAANGNKDALDFFAKFWAWAHSQDDLVDRDKGFPVAHHTNIAFDLIEVLGTNKFFQEHASQLLPVILTSSLAYISSEKWKNDPDPINRITAQVLKSEYLNVFLASAYLTGGFQLAAKLNDKYRIYAFDKEPIKTT